MKYSFYNILLLSVIITFTSCKKETQQSTESPSTKINTDVEKTSFPLEMNPTYTISVSGEIKPFEQTLLYAKVSGFIKQIYVDRGNVVKKGQLLAVLEAPEMYSKYLSEKSNQDKSYSDYLLAKQVYERLQEASKTDGAIAKIELDRALSNMNSAKANFDSAKASTQQTIQIQDYLKITAPFDGIITERFISNGALVGNPNEPLFKIAQNNKLRLVTAIPEKHANAISENTIATYQISSYPGKDFVAKLSRTSGILNESDRSLTIEFDIDNTLKELQGGDYAQIQLNLQRKQPTLWINSKNILHTQSGTFVQTKNKTGEISNIPIKLGVQLDTIIEIFGALNSTTPLLNKPIE